MENFLYVIIFITGCFFGSFFTLAVYRIPKKEDILIKHSYCPNCNHKLGFFDLFPVLSYIFLGGKCRYCKTKIRPRYLILELLSGCVFLCLTILTQIDILSIKGIIELSFLLIYVSILFIIAGIDKENIEVPLNVLLFGFVFEILYIIYQCTVSIFNVYQYVIYIAICVIIFLILNKKEKNKEYLVQNLYLSFYIIIYSGIKICFYTIILSFILSKIYKKFKNITNKVPLGFYLAVSNMAAIVLSNIVINYI